MKKIQKFIYYIFFIAIGLIAFFVVLAAFPDKSGIKAMIVLSGSMEPKIKTGSVVVIKKESNYSIGDIITFGEEFTVQKTTTHRIVQEKESEDGEKAYITKGDANSGNDPDLVLKDEVLGKVLFWVPYVGYGVAATQKPIGFVLIIVIPATIIIYDEFGKIKKEIGKIRKEKSDQDEKDKFENNNKNET